MNDSLPAISSGNMMAAVQHETAATSAAAKAQAMVQAQYLVALQRPRNLDLVWEKFSKECKRPAFAEDAEYSLPRGGKTITGETIGFMQALLSAYGNARVDVVATYDDDEKRVLSCTVHDFESNSSWGKDLTIAKLVKRRKTKPTDEIVRTLTNSAGETTHLVRATEDELLMVENALVSKTVRNGIKRTVPGWMVEQGLELCRQTKLKKTSSDPDAARRILFEAFALLGISVADLAEYLGHTTERIQPVEIEELRSIYRGLKDGSTRWSDIIEERREERDAGPSIVPLTPEDEAAARTRLKKEIAKLRIQKEPKVYEDACHEATLDPKSDWQKDAPLPVLERVLAAMRGGA